MQKISPWPLFSLLGFLVFLDFTTTSCASVSSPSGGPRDTISPKIDTSFPPNFSTHFKSQKIQLIFSEYLQLKSPSQQITISPPLENKLQIEAQGKEVNLSWTDSLQPNTTYTISFGNAITDFTEGNVNDRFKYVFSTGSFIDSLQLSGSLTNSRTGKPEKELLVALYDWSQVKHPDSVAYFGLPSYYSYTDENGNFSLENLKYAKYHVVAFEDKRGNFKLNTGAEKMAFLKDTLSLNDSTPQVELYSFLPKEKDRFFGAKHSSWGKIELPFNYRVPSLKIEEQNAPADTKALLTFGPGHDTAYYWFDQAERDSLSLLLSLDDQLFDTSNIFLRPFEKGDFRAAVLATEITFEQPIRLRANYPLGKINLAKILLYTTKDSLKLDSTWQPSSMELALMPRQRKSEFKIYLMEGAMESLTGLVNDSLSYTINSLKGEELGSLYFKVETDSTAPLVLIISNSDGEEIKRHSFRGNTSVSLRNKKAGIYGVKLIVDEDGNGEWSTGQYLSRTQPERIINYREETEIRANWELELIWQPDIKPR